MTLKSRKSVEGFFAERNFTQCVLGGQAVARQKYSFTGCCPGKRFAVPYRNVIQQVLTIEILYVP
jgi:hypothetical protein